MGSERCAALSTPALVIQADRTSSQPSGPKASESASDRLSVPSPGSAICRHPWPQQASSLTACLNYLTCFAPSSRLLVEESRKHQVSE